MATQVGPRTKLKLTKKNRVAILKRAREIISDRKHWTKGRLRRKTKGVYRYCLLGACEQAAYDLELFAPGETRAPFWEGETWDDTGGVRTAGLGYELGQDISLYSYSRETRGQSPDSVNDREGHVAAVKLLDDYLAEVKKGNARPPEEA